MAVPDAVKPGPTSVAARTSHVPCSESIQIQQIHISYEVDLTSTWFEAWKSIPAKRIIRSLSAGRP